MADKPKLRACPTHGLKFNIYCEKCPDVSRFNKKAREDFTMDQAVESARKKEEAKLNREYEEALR